MSPSESRQAVIYCRVSSIKQTKAGDGLHSQEIRCREFARMKGYGVLQVFCDDVSGSLIDRPGMKAMLAFIRKKRTGGTVVIIDDVSRLARGLEAHLELRAAIAKAGGVLESPSIEFGDDPDSRLVENLLASVSQHQRQKNGEQTMNRMKARVSNGYAVFAAPMGYEYARVSGRGKMLKPVEPVASIMREALEGFASGRFETQSDMGRFLEAHPLFPKDTNGKLRQNRVPQFLNQPAYAGYVEAPKWGVSLRPGQHEPLISFRTYQRIQERLNGVNRMPKRQNLDEDFPLRGFVLCADCGGALTSCWSTGKAARHPYYLCPRKGCASYGKSIRRADLEGRFEAILHTIQPSEALFRVARRLFKDLWDRRAAEAEGQAKALGAKLARIEKQVGQFLERIVESSVPSVIGAYEEKVRKLEEEKLLLREQMAGAGRSVRGFDETLRTALEFLSNPWNLWGTGQLSDRRTVLKLAFAERLVYSRDDGFRTAQLSLPFKMLSNNCGTENKMARPTGIEPVTPCLEGRCSIQLSYGRLKVAIL